MTGRAAIHVNDLLFGMGAKWIAKAVFGALGREALANCVEVCSKWKDYICDEIADSETLKQGRLAREWKRKGSLELKVLYVDKWPQAMEVDVERGEIVVLCRDHLFTYDSKTLASKTAVRVRYDKYDIPDAAMLLTEDFIVTYASNPVKKIKQVFSREGDKIRALDCRPTKNLAFVGTWRKCIYAYATTSPLSNFKVLQKLPQRSHHRPHFRVSRRLRELNLKLLPGGLSLIDADGSMMFASVEGGRTILGMVDVESGAVVWSRPAGEIRADSEVATMQIRGRKSFVVAVVRRDSWPPLRKVVLVVDSRTGQTLNVLGDLQTDVPLIDGEKYVSGPYAIKERHFLLTVEVSQAQGVVSVDADTLEMTTVRGMSACNEECLFAFGESMMVRFRMPPRNSNDSIKASFWSLDGGEGDGLAVSKLAEVTAPDDLLWHLRRKRFPLMALDEDDFSVIVAQPD